MKIFVNKIHKKFMKLNFLNLKEVEFSRQKLYTYAAMNMHAVPTSCNLLRCTDM